MKFVRLAAPAALMLAAAVAAPAWAEKKVVPPEKPEHGYLHEGHPEGASSAYIWLDICLEASARDVEKYGARPTILSRQMAIWATAAFDAWAAYDEKAVGSRLGGKLRRPKAEHMLENKEKAIGYASYHSLKFALPDAADYFTEQMKAMGYDPAVMSEDMTTPEGIGYLAAKAVIDYRRTDGSNQFGDEIGSDGEPYSDFTFYRPVNPPDKILDPDRWQPIAFTGPDGKKFTPGFLTPHWYRVKPFVLENSAQFRPGPPPTMAENPKLLREQTDKVLEYNQTLTNDQKAVVEFMRDGPRSTAQSGHWLRFAQDVSRRDKLGIDEDIKLYFAVANTAFDAFISCWETKRYYDSSRPWTLIHYYYKGKKIIGWAGPKGGTAEMMGEEWHPYSPLNFITPPFPGYTSGHATVSGACAKIIELYTGSNEFGFLERRPHCVLTEMKSGEEVTIDLNTWSGVAEMAALSRALGGYHIPIDNDVGVEVGRKLANWSWPKYQGYYDGTEKVRD